jgi:hypothetical protein
MKKNKRDGFTLNHSEDHRGRNAARRIVIITITLLIFGAGVALCFGKILRAAGPSLQEISPDQIWQDVVESSIKAQGAREIIPAQYRTVRLDMSALKTALAKAPLELTEAANKSSLVIGMPMPTGVFARFKVEESPMMEPGLAAKFPDVKTYQGYGLDDRTATMRFDITMRGFHAIILSVEGDVFIDPYTNNDTEYYISYYKRNLARGGEPFRCFTEDTGAIKSQLSRSLGPNFAGYGTRYVFRLAVAATGEYVTAIRLPTDNENQARTRSLMAIMTTVNRVNSIYRRDISIFLVLIANNFDIIYADPNLDPYTAPPGTSQANQENQENLDEEIGEDNYDIGHVVGTGMGGLASRASACQDNKAMGSTGLAMPFGDPFDIDYVAHEMGHQFGATHTFNDGVNGSCGGGNRAAETAMEPGSGSTIMGYAGICGGPGGTAGGNLQRNTDAYFHTISIEEIFVFLTLGEPFGPYCSDQQLTGNTIPEFPPLASHTIPARTPFELNAGELIDTNGGVITYCWEEYDLGAPSPPEGDGDGQQRPIFRSFNPSLNPGRMFPSPFFILNNSNTPPATYPCTDAAGNPFNCITGESLPTMTQTMTFRVTARDQQDGISWEQLQVSVVSTAGPFTVNTPSPAVWTKGARRTVTWNVANTNVAPINCANVKISLSVDGGITFPYVLVGSTPNDGSEVITVPDVEAIGARIKVEAVGNIFFDVSDGSVNIKPIEVTTEADNGSNLAPVQESLREAIIAANSVSGVQTIPFNIPGGGVKTINLMSELPPIENPIILDGWSQGPSGYSGPPLIELNGASAGANSAGLIVNGGNSTIRGLAINRFGNAGIVLQFHGGNKVEACYIGTNAAGTGMAANGANGISINNVPNNDIGRVIPGAENIIAGNNVGVLIIGSNATGNRVMNNYIGTNTAGADLGNTLDGVRITDAPGNLIGGTRNEGGILLPTGNVISGNGNGNNSADGIEITGATASGNMIQGNLIGLDSNGNTALGNQGSGVRIENAPMTKVGGTNGAFRNVIAASGNQAGIALVGLGSSGTTIQGNYIGTDAAGNVARPNNAYGIYVDSGNNTIGGTVAGAGNVISGYQTTGGIGIYLAFNGTTGTTIQGNLIGTNAAGTAALSNVGTGIELRGTNNILIGGGNNLARNIISGNFTAISTFTCNNVRVQGNYIGTNAAGTAAVPNVRGVFLDGSTNMTVGGATAGQGNVISGNGSGGNDRAVNLFNVSGSFVQGNLIGTNAAGTAAMSNGAGVFIAGGSGNTIGGAGAARNIISANVNNGIVINNSDGNTVQNNFIGTDINGTANLGNGQTTGESGVTIFGSNNAVLGNIIANSGCFCFGNNFGFGLRVFSGTGNRIEANSIYNNARIGIDLEGGTQNAFSVTANDNCDLDSGPNNLQNFPVLTAAVNGTGNLRIEGTLNATASTSYNLHFYAGTSCDASGNGEGQTYLGTASVVTAGNCVADFSGENGITLSGVTVPAGRVVTATATDNAGNTSEFSACVTVTGVCGAVAPSGQTFTYLGGNGKANVTAAAECNWTAVSNDSWIVLSSDGSGTGDGAVSFVVRENFGGERTGTLTIANQVFTVTQLGSCVYTISPTLASHPASGGTGSINVQTSNNCIRGAISNDNWIIITSPNGTGSGVVTYSVTANNGPARVGTITVVGKMFTVKQKGS